MPGPELRPAARGEERGHEAHPPLRPQAGRVLLVRGQPHRHDGGGRRQARGEYERIAGARTLGVADARLERLSGRGAPEIVVTCRGRTGPEREFVVPLVCKLTDRQVDAIVASGHRDVVVVDLKGAVDARKRELGRHFDRCRLVAEFQDPSLVESVMLDEGWPYARGERNGRREDIAAERRRRRAELAEAQRARAAAEAEERRREREERERIRAERDARKEAERERLRAERESRMEEERRWSAEGRERLRTQREFYMEAGRWRLAGDRAEDEAEGRRREEPMAEEGQGAMRAAILGVSA